MRIAYSIHSVTNVLCSVLTRRLCLNYSLFMYSCCCLQFFGGDVAWAPGRHPVKIPL